MRREREEEREGEKEGKRKGRDKCGDECLVLILTDSYHLAKTFHFLTTQQSLVLRLAHFQLLTVCKMGRSENEATKTHS